MDLRRFRSGLWALALTLTVASCGPANSPSMDSDSTANSGIIGGSRVTDRQTQAARSVVLVELINRFGFALGFCSATLIAPNTVLTAAHCFDEKNIKGLAGFNVVFTNNYEMYLRDTSRKGLRWARHPKYNSTKTYDHDIAVAVFEGGLPDGYLPVNIDTNKGANYSRKNVYVYGYGRSQDYTGRPGEDLAAHTGDLHRGVMQIESNYNRFPDRYWLNSAIPVFICQGDSGGPQFFHEQGVLKIIGVNSAVYGRKLPNGQNSCKGTAQATKVAPFADWIKKSRLELMRLSSVEALADAL